MLFLRERWLAQMTRKPLLLPAKGSQEIHSDKMGSCGRLEVGFYRGSHAAGCRS